MKHLATAALMSLVLNIVNYSIDLLSKDLTLNDLSLIKLLTDFFVYFFSYFIRSFNYHYIIQNIF